MKTKLEEAILGSGSARSEMMARRRQIAQVQQGKNRLTTSTTGHQKFMDGIYKVANNAVV